MSFKVGDEVVCIDAGVWGPCLKTGQTYRITAATHVERLAGLATVCVDCCGRDAHQDPTLGAWFAHRFRYKPKDERKSTDISIFKKILANPSKFKVTGPKEPKRKIKEDA